MVTLKEEILPGMYLDHVPGWEGDVHEEPDPALEVLLLRHSPDDVRHLKISLYIRLIRRMCVWTKLRVMN
jgi:hypothetical protein